MAYHELVGKHVYFMSAYVGTIVSVRTNRRGSFFTLDMPTNRYYPYINRTEIGDCRGHDKWEIRNER